MKRYWIVSHALILLMNGSVLMANREQADQPSLTEHPRIFFTADDLEDLRQRAASSHEDIWLSIKDYVDREVGTKPPNAAPLMGSGEDYRNFGNQPILALSSRSHTESTPAAAPA